MEFPESNFVDQIELLLKDPEEKEKFFQVSGFLLNLMKMCMLDNLYV